MDDRNNQYNNGGYYGDGGNFNNGGGYVNNGNSGGGNYEYPPQNDFNYYTQPPVKKNKTPVIIISVAASVVILGIIIALIFLFTGNNSGGTPPVNNNVNPPAVQTTAVQQTEQENYAPAETQAQNNLPPAIPPKNPPSPPANVKPNNNSGNPDYSEGILKKNQYDLNIFISNFTECAMGNFTGVPRDDDLVDFALCYYYLNTLDDYDYITRTDKYGCNYKISEKQVHRNISKYFNASKNYGFFSGKTTSFCKNYADGNFYYYLDQLFPGGFAVVKNVEASGNTYYCNFDVYRELTPDPYYSDLSLNKPYYGINAEEANAYVKSGVLYGEGSGTAQITASNINDRSTYKLTSFNFNYN